MLDGLPTKKGASSGGDGKAGDGKAGGGHGFLSFQSMIEPIIGNLQVGLPAPDGGGRGGCWEGLNWGPACGLTGGAGLPMA